MRIMSTGMNNDFMVGSFCGVDGESRVGEIRPTKNISLSNMSSVKPPIKKMRQILDKLGNDVVRLRLDHTILDSGDRMYLFSSFLRRSKKLEELSVRSDPYSSTAEWVKTHEIGDALFDALKEAPSLKRLKLIGVSFSSPGVVEEFFETAKNLLTVLHLEKIRVTDAQEQGNGAFVADAFRRGLCACRSLEEVSLYQSGMDSRLYQEALFGLAKQPSLKRLQLVSVSCGTSAGRTERSLVQCSSSLEVLDVEFVDIGAHAQVLLGVSQSSSIKCLHFHGPGMSCSLSDSGDAKLANAFMELFAYNSSLRYLTLYSTKFGTETENALATGLATSGTMSLEKLSLYSIALKGDSDLMYQLGRINEVHFDGVQIAPATGRPNETRHPESVKLHTFYATDSSESVLRALSTLLELLPPLKQLTLDDCDLRPGTGLWPLAGLVRMSKYLETLELNNNSELCSNADATNLLLSAVRDCPTLKRLVLDGTGLRPEECALNLRRLLQDSQLTYLSLWEGNYSITRDVARVVAEGLRRNKYLEELYLPCLCATSAGIIGDSLTENVSLRTLYTETWEERREDEAQDESSSLFEFDEDAALSFIRAMPRMKGLRHLRGTVNYCESTPKLESELTVSMEQNTTLRGLSFFGDLGDSKKAQFFVSLNRFGREYVLRKKDESEKAASIPAALWPHVLSRMTGPKHTSELYYFLSKKVDFLLQGDQSTRKRKVPEHDPHDGDKPYCGQ